MARDQQRCGSDLQGVRLGLGRNRQQENSHSVIGADGVSTWCKQVKRSTGMQKIMDRSECGKQQEVQCNKRSKASRS